MKIIDERETQKKKKKRKNKDRKKQEGREPIVKEWDLNDFTVHLRFFPINM